MSIAPAIITKVSPSESKMNTEVDANMLVRVRAVKKPGAATAKRMMRRASTATLLKRKAAPTSICRRSEGGRSLMGDGPRADHVRHELLLCRAARVNFPDDGAG